MVNLTAYRGTGKDALVLVIKYVSEHPEKTKEIIDELGWKVWGPKDKTLEIVLSGIVRVALADILKRIVCKQLGFDKVQSPKSIYSKWKLPSNEGSADRIKQLITKLKPKLSEKSMISS